MENKLIKSLQTGAGWILTILGALLTIEGIILAVSAVFGLLDFGSFEEGIVPTIMFVLSGLLGIWLFRLGRRLRGNTNRSIAEDSPQKKAEIPEAETDAAKEPCVPPASDPEAIVLTKSWGGRMEHGKLWVELRRQSDGVNVQITDTTYDSANNPTVKTRSFTIPEHDPRLHDPQKLSELLATGSIRFTQEELFEKIPGLKKNADR